MEERRHGGGAGALPRLGAELGRYHQQAEQKNVQRCNAEGARREPRVSAGFAETMKDCLAFCWGKGIKAPLTYVL